MKLDLRLNKISNLIHLLFAMKVHQRITKLQKLIISDKSRKWFLFLAFVKKKFKTSFK